MSPEKRWVLILVVSIISIIHPTAPGQASDAEIRIGATFPRSGNLEYYGISAFYGANTAVRKINANGGVGGKRLVLEWRDNRGEPAQARRDIEELVREHQVQAIIGPLLSDSAMACRELARDLGVVLLSPMATIDALPSEDPWVFRSVFSSSAEAVALARFQLEKYGRMSCGIVYDSSHQASGELAETFAKTFATEGGTVLGRYNIRAENGSIDFEDPLRELSAMRPDFLFAPLYGVEAMALILALRDMNLPIPVCGSNTWDSEVVFDGSGTRLVGTTFASVLFERAASRQFREFFTAMEEAGMENPDAPAACAYDAVMLLAKALENGDSAEDIRQGLLSIRNLNLATGRISITPDGDTRKPVLIRLVERQGYHLVPVYAERYDPPSERRRR